MTRVPLLASLALALCSTAAVLLLALSPSPAGAQRAGDLCPATMPSSASQLECSCPATAGGASVWGTDFYTDDSSLCHAAVHAGAIPATGGTIRVRAMPGRDYYSGSRRNGISTGDYGRWGRTIVFDGAKSVAAAGDGAPLCPGTYDAGGQGWSGACRCLGVGNGPVWGSDVYTTDSDLCRAARHAGAIGAGGGVVQVTAAPGRSSYAGSTRNGVTTSNWGSYGSSFRVAR